MAPSGSAQARYGRSGQPCSCGYLLTARRLISFVPPSTTIAAPFLPTHYALHSGPLQRAGRCSAIFAAASSSSSSGPLQRPSGAPGGGSTSTDLLLQRLSRASSLGDILALVEGPSGGRHQATGGGPRGAAGGDSFVNVELLAALARCCSGGGSAGPGSSGGGKRAAEELERMWALLPGRLKDLSGRVGCLSFKQLSSTLKSLVVLLTRNRTAVVPLTASILALVGALPETARSTTTPPPSLKALEEAFSAAQQLLSLTAAAAASAASSGTNPKLQQEQQRQLLQQQLHKQQQQLYEYLRTEVTEGPGCVERLRSGADMAELAAAVTLVARFGLPQSPPLGFVEAVVGRVEELMAAACPPGPLLPEPLHADVSPTSAASETASAATPSAAAGDATEGERKGKKRDRKAAPSKLQTQPLDVRSLTLLLTHWCSRPPFAAPSSSAAPQQQQGQQVGLGGAAGPSGGPQQAVVAAGEQVWADWVSRCAEAVWLTQDVATQARREELAAEVAGLEEQLVTLRREEQRLVRAEKQQQEQQRQQQQRGHKQQRQAQPPQQQQDRKGGTPAVSGTDRGVGRGGITAQHTDPSPARDDQQPQEQQPFAFTDAAAAAAAIGSATADMQRAIRELRSLGPSPAPSAPASASSSAAAGALEAELLVELAFQLGRCLGGRASRQGCELAEVVLLGRMEELTAKGKSALVIKLLAAFRHLRHAASPPLFAASLHALLPHLESLPAEEALPLLTVLEAFGAQPPTSPQPEAVLQPLAHAVSKEAARSSGRGVPVPVLLSALLRRCAAWGVRVPEEALRTIQRAVEPWIRWEVNPGLQPGLYRALQENRRFMAETAKTQPPQDHQQQQKRAGGSMLEVLMDGVVLPLAQLGQAFAEPDTYAAALNYWRTVGPFEGLDARRAAALLRTVALAQGWHHSRVMREDLEQLLVDSLHEEALLRLPEAGGARQLAELLAAAGGAMPVMANKVERGGGIAERAAPLAAPLLLPAVDWLLELQPHADEVALAAQALFVDLRWGRGAGQEDGAGADAAAAADQGEAHKQPHVQLLERMLAAAEPTLEAAEPADIAVEGVSIGRGRGCSAQGCAYLLAACVSCGYTPPLVQLARLYGRALHALQSQHAPAAVLVSLADSMGRLGAGTDAAGASSKTSRRPGAPGSLCDDPSPASRGALLQALADGLLHPAALSELSKQPKQLVETVWQLTRMGARLNPAWVHSYDSLVLKLMPNLEPAGLAHAAASLALLGASPQASWVDALLKHAEQQGGHPRFSRFKTYDLGLLLGGVHALYGSGGGGSSAASSKPRAGTAASAPSSDAAMQAWSRAHVTFVNDPLSQGVLPKYSPSELQLVAAAVAAYELARQGGGSKQGRPKGGKGSSVVSSTDCMGRVQPAWLEACGGALLKVRRGCLQRSPSTGAAAEAASPMSPAVLPPAGLLLDLLRLASCVVAGSTDGSIRRLVAAAPPAALEVGPTGHGALAASDVGSGQEAAVPAALTAAAAPAASTETVKLLEYVRLSLTDWASVGGNTGSAVVDTSGDSEGLPLADWQVLLRAALDAGLQPAAPELEAYCSRLFASLAEKANRHDSSDDQRHALWRAVSSALTSVLLPVLPWSPPAHIATVFREAFLLHVPLQQASMRQLGLLCTYCVQTGLGSDAVWSRVREELIRRLPQESARAAVAATTETQVQASKGLAGKKPAPKATAPCAAPSALSQLDGAQGVKGGGGRLMGGEEGPQERVAAADLAAVCYALEIGRCGAGQAAVRWLWELQERQQQPGSSGQEQGAWYSGSRLALSALSALQRLWMSRSAVVSPPLPPAEEVLEGMAATAVAAEALTKVKQPVAAEELWQSLLSSVSGLDLLLPSQLVQLVALRAEAARTADGTAGGGARIAAHMPSDIGVRLLQRLAAPTVRPSLKDAEAALALLHCLPAALGRAEAFTATSAAATGSEAATSGATFAIGGRGRAPLPPYAVALAEAAEEALPLADVIELLLLLEGRSGWRMSQRRLEKLVERLLRAVEAVTATNQMKGDGHKQLQGAAWTLERALQVARALLTLAPVQQEQHQQQKAVRLTITSEALTVITPFLQRLVPAAEERLRNQVNKEVLGGLVENDKPPEIQHAEYVDHGTPLPPLEDVPPELAAQVVVAMIEAAGEDMPLPRPLAAIAILLLGCPGAAQRMPQAQLQQALAHSLVGHADLPMPDSTAEAILSARLAATGVTPARELALTRQLRLCGASASHSQRLLMALPAKESKGFGLEEAEFFLREMYDCGLQLLQTKPDDSFTIITHCIFKTHLLASPSRLSLAVDTLRHADLVAPRLGRSATWAILSVACMRSAELYVRHVLPERSSSSGNKCNSAVDSGPLWQFLDLLCNLGPVSLTSVFMDSLEPDKSYRAILGRVPFRDTNFMNFCGPYTLDAGEAISIANYLWPEVEAHAAAVDLSKPTAAAPEGAPLLTCRQLGVLYGVVGMIPDHLSGGYEGKLQSLREQLLPLYLHSLSSLATLEPQEGPKHPSCLCDKLNAFLDALEPVICANPVDRALPAGYDAPLQPLVRELVANLVAVTITTAGDAFPLDEQTSFNVDTPFVRNTALGRVSEGEVYYNLLSIIEDMQPPPEYRDKINGVLWDAGLEAYVLRVLPWYRAARRLLNIILTSALGSFRDELATRGVEGPGCGRWANLMWGVSVVCPEYDESVGPEAAETSKHVAGMEVVVGLEDDAQG
ncbi:hypothetical protein Agub_g3977 [Astrephomene gubernaculifera]|uniref:Uncharacterized protein n=1 Tax=Astrephomene gubernaculifera TaxID=47775 RepID=A0AAD3HJH9_9CHLO|nr:hypothetical protein Agub_g3977 [Astrephomene gubernaculifera]